MSYYLRTIPGFPMQVWRIADDVAVRDGIPNPEQGAGTSLPSSATGALVPSWNLLPPNAFKERGTPQKPGGCRRRVRLMSGIGIAFAVAGWVLFGVTLLAFVGLLTVGLGWTERAGAGAEARDRDSPQKGLDFDRDPEARRRFIDAG
jgi:hypothetical protein